MEETNTAITARRFMNTLRTILFVLRKGISKAKITGRDLSTLKRRGKIAGKVVQSLLSLHHHIHNIQTPPPPPSNVVEFVKRNKQSASNRFFTCVHAPETFELDDDPPITVEENAMEMGFSGASSPDFFWSPMVLNDSPMLPGFGRTPAVKQLRVTDSPYPVEMDAGGGHDSHVDEAAEKFIARFYEALRKQT